MSIGPHIEDSVSWHRSADAVWARYQRGSAKPVLADKWGAVRNAAELVARLAGQDFDQGDWLEMPVFGQDQSKQQTTRHRIAEQAIEDMLAMLEPGLTALIAANDHGQGAAVAARALLEEINAANRALHAMLAIPVNRDCVSPD